MNSFLLWQTMLHRVIRLLAMFALTISMTSAASQGTEDDLLQLAAAARATLAERIEPAEVSLACLRGRTAGKPLRDYVLREQNEALQTLVQIGRHPEQADTVRRALQRLARSGYDTGAVELLLQQVSRHATGLRLATSLGALPAALFERSEPLGCMPFSPWAGFRDVAQGLPLARLGLANLRRLAELEPERTWNLLALAWAEGISGEEVLQKVLRQTDSDGSINAKRMHVFALQQLAWLRLQQGRHSEASNAASQAASTAAGIEAMADTQGARGDSTIDVEQATREAAQTSSALALVLANGGQKKQALDVLLKLAVKQQRLAKTSPDDLPQQYALIDTWFRMHDLRDPEALPNYSQQASDLYQRVIMRAPFKSSMVRSTVTPGMVVTAFMTASVLTCILGLLLLFYYRRRVARLMMTAATSHPPPQAATAVATAPVKANPPITQHVGALSKSAATQTAATMQRQAAMMHVLAGIAFGLTASLWQLHAMREEVLINRLLLLTWTWAWPTVLALGVVWDGDRRRQGWVWLAYFAGLSAISLRIGFSPTPPLLLFGFIVPAWLQGWIIWASSLSFSPLLLLFLNRSVRSIGPTLLVMMIVGVAGGLSTVMLVSMPLVMSHLIDAMVALRVPSALIAPYFFAIVGFLLSLPVAWWMIRQLRTIYAAHFFSEQDLLIGTLWFFQSLQLALSLYIEIGVSGLYSLLLAVLPMAVVRLGMWPLVRAASGRQVRRLLLLRVFTRRDAQGRVHSRRRAAERLFDQLSARWRYIGPIMLIGAPDLAGSTIDPEKFSAVLVGQLRQRFVLQPTEVSTRIAAIDERCDLDGRWRVTEMFCGDTTWRPMVTAMMARCDLVAMDLRDFNHANQGCLFELQALVDLVPAQRVVLLVDNSTERDFLATTLADCSAKTSAGSPNAARQAHMRLIDLEAGEQAAIDQMLASAEPIAQASA